MGIDRVRSRDGMFASYNSNQLTKKNVIVICVFLFYEVPKKCFIVMLIPRHPATC